MRKIVLSLLCFLMATCLFAQDTAATLQENPATGLRANEKIYVVVAVLLIILAGLFIYMIRLDRKITRLEKSA